MGVSITTTVNDASENVTKFLRSGKTYPSNCALAGNPAKVIKESVTWHPELI